MRRKIKRFRFLFFALSVLASFFLAYAQTDALGELHYLSPHQTWAVSEVADQEDTAAGPPDPPKEIALPLSPNVTCPGVFAFEKPFTYPILLSPCDLRVTILRC